MKHHVIAGAGGVRLHVVDTGNASGRPIVFIHGFSQSWLSWARQLDSDLGADHRLVAVDLRGHGESDKPRDAYAESRLWADDVHAVIEALQLERPVLCGWSYGPLVILDYLRHHGEDAVAGIHFVGGITKLGSEEATAVLTPELLALVPGLFSADAEDSVRSLAGLLDLCFAVPLAREDRYRMLGCAVSAPPHVRQALFSRAFDNDDLLPRLRTPALIVHGTADAVVKPEAVTRQMARMPLATVRMMDTGHGCFWDDAPAYNRMLDDFAHACA
jgi:pimeloyl-ACP methyl ester carboxylesterase